MTRTQLMYRIQNHLNNSVFYTDDDLKDSIQDGLDETVAYSGAIVKSAVIELNKDQTYYDFIELLPDFAGLVGIYNTVTKSYLNPTTRRQLGLNWATAIGTPDSFAPINHRWVAIASKPTVNNYGKAIVFYRTTAPQLDDSIEIPLPEDSLALEEYVKVDLWEQAQEFMKAKTEFSYYVADLERLRRIIQERTNQRIPNLRG